MAHDLERYRQHTVAALAHAQEGLEFWQADGRQLHIRWGSEPPREVSGEMIANFQRVIATCEAILEQLDSAER